MNPDELLTRALHAHADSLEGPLDPFGLQHRLRRADRTRTAQRATAGGLACALVLGGAAFGLGQHDRAGVSTAETTDAPGRGADAGPSTTTPATSSSTTPDGDAPAAGPGGEAEACTRQQMNTTSTAAVEAVAYWKGTARPGTVVDAVTDGGWGTASTTADESGAWVLRVVLDPLMPTRTPVTITVRCGADGPSFADTFTWYPGAADGDPGVTTTTPPTTPTTTAPSACSVRQMNTTSASTVEAVAYWKGTARPGTQVRASAANGWGTASTTADATGAFVLRLAFSTSMPKNTPVAVTVTCVDAGKTFASTFTWTGPTATTAPPTTTPATTAPPTTKPPTTTTTAPASTCTVQQINTSSASTVEAVGYWKGAAKPGTQVTAVAANGWGTATATADATGAFILRLAFSPSMPKNTPVAVTVYCIDARQASTYSFTWVG